MNVGHIGSGGRRRLLAVTALGTLGAMTAGCAGANRAVVPAATTSAQVSQPAGTGATDPAGTGATNPAGTGATNPATPAAAPANGSAVDEEAAGQQLSSVDQDLAQALNDLDATDQATSSGESDVPGN